jgi:hypothetical protein
MRSPCRGAAGQDWLAFERRLLQERCQCMKSAKTAESGLSAAEDVETRPLGSQSGARMNTGRGRHELVEQVQAVRGEGEKAMLSEEDLKLALCVCGVVVRKSSKRAKAEKNPGRETAKDRRGKCGLG